jgi:hypothetical protein
MSNFYSLKLSTKKKQILIILFFIFLAVASMLAQPVSQKNEETQAANAKSNIKTYIHQFASDAVEQMIEFKIPASVTLAQAIFESGSGTSELAKTSNNHFGIKCHGVWIGDTIVRDDDVANECFRKYYHVEDSYRDHSLFLVTRKRYAFLFDYAITDYKAWCYGLKKTCYATYPHYAENLIKIIEEQKLYELDRVMPLKPIFASMTKKASKAPQLKISRFNPKLYNIKEFNKEGLIWLDERDVLVQSLDMILIGSDEESMAGNP